ncbi:MAG: glycine cleavage system protein H [bacterium]|nr:glycine cleavage system protein H [bacterium]
MGEIQNCLLPDDLLYHVDYNVWLRDNGDGTFHLGMTDVAQSMAGAMLHCRAKRAGRTVKQGKSLATVESGKWVGPVKSPFTCEVVAVNEAVAKDATILNRSPYTEGWIIQVKPETTEEAGLVSGDAAIEGFKAYMAEHEVEECIHCEGFEG